jgi:formylmethanofuran dehydrogenase subunit E
VDVPDILTAKGDDIFDVTEPKEGIPKRARVFKSMECARCGESTMETRVHILREQFLCTPCYEKAISG